MKPILPGPPRTDRTAHPPPETRRALYRLFLRRTVSCRHSDLICARSSLLPLFAACVGEETGTQGRSAPKAGGAYTYDSSYLLKQFIKIVLILYTWSVLSFSMAKRGARAATPPGPKRAGKQRFSRETTGRMSCNATRFKRKMLLWGVYGAG